MHLVVSDAIVLHAFDYRETSRILRLATREAGVLSAVARGARRPKNRFSAAVDLFAGGSVQIAMNATRDLHTLVAFDVTRARPALAERWPRFAAANALSEILLRFASDDTHPALFEAYDAALSALEVAEANATSAGLGGAWRLVSELGFAPSLDGCASCGSPLDPGAPARFAHRAGGALCASCALQAPGARDVPAADRALIGAWIGGATPEPPDDRSALAHLRLLREFLYEHLADHKPLRAFAVWERGDWPSKAEAQTGRRGQR